MRKSLPSCVETCNSHCREWKGREGGRKGREGGREGREGGREGGGREGGGSKEG